MNEVYAALAKVQAELPGLKKSATNPHFKSKYIPLEDIVEASDPVLAKHGLVFYSTPTYIEGLGTPALSYMLVHVESGDDVSDTMPLILDKQNSQGVGSAITYARRYVLTSLLNIIADVDDDGNKASAPPKKSRVARGLEDASGNVSVLTAAEAAREPGASFTDQVRATGKKAAEIREWAASEGYTLDDVGVDAKGLTAFLNSLSGMKRAKLLEWAS